MIVLFNSPGIFENLLARIFLVFETRVFTLGTDNISSSELLFPITFTKKDRIGFVNHPGTEIIDSFLASDSIEKVIDHFSMFFPKIRESKKKLRHAYASKNNFFLVGKVDFFLRNEIECDKQVIIIFDAKFSSFISTPFSLLNRKVYHIYLPFLDTARVLRVALGYLFKKLLNVFSPRISISDTKFTSCVVDEYKQVAIFFHKGQSYGKLYRKDHYYSKDPLSMLHESRIRKLSYESDLDQEILNVDPFIDKKDLMKIVRAIPLNLIFTFLSIRGLKDILILTFIYMRYLGWRNAIPSLGVRGVVYDYDILFPKALSLALESLEVKTCSLQERPITMFYNFHFGVIVDVYYASGEIFKKYADRKPDLLCAKEIISYLPWRLTFFNENRTDELFSHGRECSIQSKKTVVFIGYYLDRTNNYPLTCTRATEEFLSYAISCASRHPDYKIIIRMKMIGDEDLGWFTDKIAEYGNILLSLDYSDSATYMLCRDSDLIVSVQSSLVEECVANGKKVILLNDLFTVSNLCSGIYPHEFHFMITRSMSEFQHRTQRLLRDSSFMENEYSELRKKIVGRFALQPSDAIPDMFEQFFVTDT